MEIQRTKNSHGTHEEEKQNWESHATGHQHLLQSQLLRWRDAGARMGQQTSGREMRILKTIKILEENLGDYLHGLWIGKGFLNRTEKSSQ